MVYTQIFQRFKGSGGLTHYVSAEERCSPQPCANGGRCTNRLLDYICDCAEGITGKNCEKRKMIRKVNTLNPQSIIQHPKKMTFSHHQININIIPVNIIYFSLLSNNLCQLQIENWDNNWSPTLSHLYQLQANDSSGQVPWSLCLIVSTPQDSVLNPKIKIILTFSHFYYKS